MLKQIKYFQAVVRCNSFSEAAEECYISQSAISQQVQVLERELGVTLLKRKSRRFSLTPAGEHFYRQSLLITADFERLCRETSQIDHGDDFTLRIGYLKGYGGTEFQKAVAAFTAKHPDVPVDMKTGNHEDLYELLRTDNVDLVLNDQRRAFSSEYVNTILTTTGCNIEISVRNPIANMGYVNVGDLRHTPCILIASKEQRENEQSYYREIYGITSQFLFADNLEEARLMVVGGKGYLPIEGGSPPTLYAETIVRLSLCKNGKPIQRNYCAFWKADNSGFYIEEFAEILKEQFDKAE
ncbi:MAG: LysR family transcriptional regulator [Christensenellaceae bacterium]|nr:LysR family transcriptional regulator [Christensenellaceae bacterium]